MQQLSEDVPKARESTYEAPLNISLDTDKITFTIDDEHLSHQITFKNAPEVVVPDTNTSSIIFSLIGIIIISLGLGFIYKNGKIIIRSVTTSNSN